MGVATLARIAETPPLIRKMFEAIDGRDWTSFVSIFHPNVIYERPGYDAIEGLESLLEFYDAKRIVASGRHQIDGWARGERSLTCWGSFAGQARDGSSLRERFADIYRLRDGLIAYRTTYFFKPAI